MPTVAPTEREIRAQIRAEASRIVDAAGTGGASVKERIGLAARRLGMGFSRVKRLHYGEADPWGWELDRLRDAERRILADRARKLALELETIKAKLGSDVGNQGLAGPAAAVDR